MKDSVTSLDLERDHQRSVQRELCSVLSRTIEISFCPNFYYLNDTSCLAAIPSITICLELLRGPARQQCQRFAPWLSEKFKVVCVLVPSYMVILRRAIWQHLISSLLAKRLYNTNCCFFIYLFGSSARVAEYPAYT